LLLETWNKKSPEGQKTLPARPVALARCWGASKMVVVFVSLPSHSPNLVVATSKHPPGLRSLIISQQATQELDSVRFDNASEGSEVMASWSKWIICILPKGRAFVYEISSRGAFALIAAFDCPLNVSCISVVKSLDEDDGAWALLGTDEGLHSHVHMLQMHGTDSFSVLPLARWVMPGGVSSLCFLSEQRVRVLAGFTCCGGVCLLDHTDAMSPRRQWPSREASTQGARSEVLVARELIPDDNGAALFVASHGDFIVTCSVNGMLTLYTGAGAAQPASLWTLDLNVDALGVLVLARPDEGLDFVVCGWSGACVVVDEQGSLARFERTPPARVQSFSAGCVGGALGVRRDHALTPANQVCGRRARGGRGRHDGRRAGV
jgi:hypothetical protein